MWKYLSIFYTQKCLWAAKSILIFPVSGLSWITVPRLDSSTLFGERAILVYVLCILRIKSIFWGPTLWSWTFWEIMLAKTNDWAGLPTTRSLEAISKGNLAFWLGVTMVHGAVEFITAFLTYCCRYYLLLLALCHDVVQKEMEGCWGAEMNRT